MEKYSNMTDAEDVKTISLFYDMLSRKASFAELCGVLAELKYQEH